MRSKLCVHTSIFRTKDTSTSTSTSVGVVPSPGVEAMPLCKGYFEAVYVCMCVVSCCQSTVCVCVCLRVSACVFVYACA